MRKSQEYNQPAPAPDIPLMYSACALLLIISDTQIVSVTYLPTSLSALSLSVWPNNHTAYTLVVVVVGLVVIGSWFSVAVKTINIKNRLEHLKDLVAVAIRLRDTAAE